MKVLPSASRGLRSAQWLLWVFAVYALCADDPSDMFSQPTRTENAEVTPSAQNYSLTPATGFSELDLNSPDNSLDGNTYYIGGGDVFRVFITDYPSLNFTGVVNENGDLFLRSIGIIPLGKVTLTRAKTIIAGYLKNRLKKPNQIHIALVKIKTVTFSMTGGAIHSPGTYVVPGQMRIWDAVKLSNKDIVVPQQEPNVSPLASYMQQSNLRWVQVRHNSDTAADHYDLLTYLFRGDLSQNPYLYPGDQIIVEAATSTIHLEGAINTSLNLRNDVPIRNNEPAGAFISLFPLDPNADSEHIAIQREDSDNHVRKFTLNLKTKENFDLPLANNDIITVPQRSNESEVLVVLVRGEVAKPGYYPISKNRTTAREIISDAGSYTPYANKMKAAIVRRSNLPTELFYHGTKEDVAEPLATMRPELSSALFMMNATKDYTVILINNNEDVVLQPGDELYFPRSNHTVYVSGSVHHPGAYPYSPGKDIEYYVKLAGGYTSRSNKANISIAAVYGHAFQTPDRKIVEDGDVVIVPLAQQYKFLSTVVMPISSLFFAGVGLLVSLITLSRQ